MVFALILVLHLADILMLYAGRRARLTFCILFSRFTQHSRSRISQSSCSFFSFIIFFVAKIGRYLC